VYLTTLSAVRNVQPQIEPLINDELEKDVKEVVMAYFSVTSWHSTAATNENRCPDRDSNWELPKHKHEALPLLGVYVHTDGEVRSKP
jgi:hypothetical protein